MVQAAWATLSTQLKDPDDPLPNAVGETVDEAVNGLRALWVVRSFVICIYILSCCTIIKERPIASTCSLNYCCARCGRSTYNHVLSGWLPLDLLILLIKQ
jgi:hypothetical protein